MAACRPGGHRAAGAACAWCLLGVHPLAAQVAPGAWPRCIAERDGQQLGLAGSVCECSHEPGGTMTGKPPGWRWSCDVMRSDGDQLEVPADSSAERQPLPPDLAYSPTYSPGYSPGYTPYYSPQDAAGVAPELPGRPSGRPYQSLPGGPTALFAGRRRQQADDLQRPDPRRPDPRYPDLGFPQPCRCAPGNALGCASSGCASSRR